jgi:hypothetical protein
MSRASVSRERAILLRLFDVACNVGKAIETTTQNVGKAIEKGTQDAGKAIEKGTQDTGKAIEKGTQDAGKAIEKGTQDFGTAGETIGRFVEHELKGIGKTLSDADKRIREGKFVDAIWHMSTDPLKHTEENAFQAAQESNMRIPANADSDSDRSRTAFR